jgi:hypothetical protein
VKWIIAIVVAVGGSVIAVVAFTSRSGINVPQNVPDEVAVLVESTWDSLLNEFPAQMECLTEPTLLLGPDLDEGDASYTRSTGIIRIEIPTSPERFPESLAHELGHHLDVVCGFGSSNSAEFLEAQGLGSDSSWTSAEHWRLIPAEHFAEAVTLLVLGSRETFDDRIELSQRSVSIVQQWGDTG